MNCPRDGHRMLRETFEDVHVDLCPGCGGAWFDIFELEKLDDATEHAGHALVARLDEIRAGSSPVDTSTPLPSPMDPSVIMMRRFADPEGTIEIDECPATGGLWLDAGELGALRMRFPDAETRDEATRVVIERVMSCPEFNAARAAEQAASARVGRIARMLGWLTPWRDAA